MTGIDLDQYRQGSLQAWQLVAPAWAAEREFQRTFVQPVSDRLLKAVAPRPGDVVLELAAGAGDLGLAASQLIGPEGRLIQTDFAPAMVAEAERLARDAGVESSEHRVVDAEHMDLEDDSADVVLCRYGYMLMADSQAALAETRRVLRGGGRLGAAVWTSPDENPWARVPMGALMEHVGAPPPPPDGPGMFSLGDPARLESLVRAAGFEQVEVERVELEQRTGSWEEYWRLMYGLAGPMRMLIDGLDPDSREQAIAKVHDAVEPYRGEDGYRFPAASLCLSAR